MKLVFAFLLCAPVILLHVTALAYQVPYILQDLARRIPRDSVAPKQANTTCTPYSREYNARIAGLSCQEDFKRAVKEDTEQSNCKNTYYNTVDFSHYDYDYDNNTHSPSCELPRDERENVGWCSIPCSMRVYGFLLCEGSAYR